MNSCPSRQFRLSLVLAPVLFAATTLASAGDPAIVKNVVNNGTTSWRIDGIDNPPLVLLRGKTYEFVMQNVSVIHPFYIKTVDSTGSNNQYNNGVTNNGATGTMTLTFTVPVDAPDSLHYNCGNHAPMNGPITIFTDSIFAAGFD